MRYSVIFCKKIREELHDACDYAKMALEYKDKRRSMAELFYTLSQDEMRHQMMLHAEVVKMIDEYKKEHGDTPPAMQAYYDLLHEENIEKAEMVKRYQELYKG